MGCGTSNMAVENVNQPTKVHPMGSSFESDDDVAMRVRFWGTRGSIAKAGPTTVRFGGNTSCVEVRTKKTLLILDMGTGAHGLGQELLATEKLPLKGHILISHTHWDHIQGVPFFAPLFVPGCEWDIYAPRGVGHSLQEALAGQMQYTYFPIQLDKLAANIRYHELMEGTFQIDDVTVHTQYLNHPALTLGYRLEVDGVSAVYSCDHEPFGHDFALGKGEMSEQDEKHVHFIRKADLCIHDAQYTAEEYAQKVGWGHSSVDCVVEMCRKAEVRSCALTHHDPMRSDDAVDALVAQARLSVSDMATPMEIFGAAEGMVVDLHTKAIRYSHISARSVPPVDLACALDLKSASSFNVVTAVGDEEGFGNIVANAIPADSRHVHVHRGHNSLDVLAHAEATSPDLVVVDSSTIGGNLVAFAAELAAIKTRVPPPLIVIARHDDLTVGVPVAGVTDWLVEPFTEQYVRTRMMAWAMRQQCRWQKAPLPPDETSRLHALRSLGILDTNPDESFDKYTRIVAAAFDVPIAVVSLVDEKRQWFKSCIGLNGATETSRDMAFCAHAILKPEPLIVPDALLDDRFAQNPLVLGEPRIRFYAGAPIILKDGSAVGSLCAIDTRPRDLDPKHVQILKDIALLVSNELELGHIDVTKYTRASVFDGPTKIDGLEAFDDEVTAPACDNASAG